ncbi:MAG: glycine--tRNA ligase subunit beta [Gammaproteobacteria bacterium]|nr:glycine--tRNA ligase subunit beta [Gammaproteobacteria bacterium]
MADTKPFLVEIGSEELPPKNLKHLAESLHRNLLAQLASNSLYPANPSEGQTFFSPRRLAIYLPKILVKQEDRAEERLGPAVSAAFDAAGRPTKAAEGFAKSCGVTVSQLTPRHTEKGERLAYTLRLKGKTAAELLPQIVSESLAKLPIQKRMRWGTGQAEFVRPVHWMVLMLGDRAIKADILGVKTGNQTYGHRFHHPAAITLKHPADYAKLLEKTGKVLVEDRHGRLVKKISAYVNHAAKQVHGRAQLDQGLLEEVAALVEWPVPITGSFDKKFLALPDEVIVAVLETQQRYFPLRDTKGKLLSYFIAISNIQSRKPTLVRSGNERVITPRLTDAEFFWESDRKTTLASRIPELDRVVFQKQLGSYADKARRTAKLAAVIAERIESDPHLAERAAQLAKCDLVTGMVGEFPELQGIMGGYYARHDGEPDEISAAIAEHYRPSFAGDALPETKTGQALAIADKLDTIVGIFAMGQKPTGDKDPFGLRRAALGLMRILVERQLDSDLTVLIQKSLAQQPAKPPSHEPLVMEIYEFLLERLRVYYLENGVRADVFEAVRAKQPHNPLDFHRRVQAVNIFLTIPEALCLASANKRIANILRQAGGKTGRTVDAEMLREPAERTLYENIRRLQRDIQPLVAAGDYINTLKKLAALRTPVDEFFDKVLVMEPDSALRENRLALLSLLSALFLQTADLAMLQTD